MKRLLLAAMLFSAAAGFAAWQPIGALRLADKDTLSSQVGLLAGFFGNPLVSMAIAAQASQYETPFMEFFGAPRKDAPIVFALYLDSEAEPCSAEGAISGVEYAVIYPVTLDAAGLKRLHKGCVVTNGLIRIPEVEDFGDGVDDAEDYGEDEVTYNYVKFSADGKWAAMSDKPEQVELAMKAVKSAEEPMQGVAAELVVSNRALKAIYQPVLKEMRCGFRTCVTSKYELVKEASSMRLTVKADAAGLEFCSFATGEKGGAIEKCAARTLEGEAFAYASKNAFFATACAPGLRKGPSAEDSLRVLVSAAKAFFGFEDLGLNLKRGEKSFEVEIDGAKLADYLNSPASLFYNRAGAKFKTFEAARMHFATNLAAYADAVNAESEYNSFSFAGDKLIATPAQRFAATMPELAGKPLAAASVLDFTSLLIAWEPVAIGMMPKPMRIAAGAMFASMRGNVDDKGAAMAMWGEGETLRAKVRIAPSQFKTIGALGAIFAAKAMMPLNGAKAVDGDED